MDPRDQLRAADADRETVAERLRHAVDEGRLDLHEYDERLGQAYAAKTYGELDRLLVDLPGPVPAARAVPAPAVAPAASPSRRSGSTRGWLAVRWGPWARVVSICVAIWAVTVLVSGQWIYFWPFWVAAPWGAVLLVSTIGGLAGGAPRRHSPGTGKRPAAG